MFVTELLAMGAVAGFLAGMFGIGGGMLMVPLLMLIFGARGFPAAHVLKIAVATSLATILFTSAASVRAHQARGAVRWDIVRWLAPGIVVGAWAGAQLARVMPARLLALLFAVFVGYSALQMLIDRKPKPSRELPGAAGLGATGSLIGVLSALVGAGGAFVSVPFMIWCNVPIHHAVGTSAALGFPIALAGTVGYVIAGWNLPSLPAAAVGFVYLPALVVISIASMAMARYGVAVAHKLQMRQLRRLFAALLVVLATVMLAKAVNA
ncbi:MAG: sulfite exporter TauE/SafE family protein [Lautropia sp.]